VRVCVCVCHHGVALTEHCCFCLYLQLADGDRILEDDRSLQTGYIFVYCAVPPS